MADKLLFAKHYLMINSFNERFPTADWRNLFQLYRDLQSYSVVTLRVSGLRREGVVGRPRCVRFTSHFDFLISGSTIFCPVRKCHTPPR